MIRYLKNCNLPDNPEILLMLVVGICLQMTDGSPFSMKHRWSLVWDIELPAEYFSLFAQNIIKTILAVIIMVRCSTTYAYVVSAMLVIFCLLKKTIPKLMLIWLLVAGIKSICMTFFEAIAGVYVCSAFGKIRRPCIEFFISKALEIIFASYLWGSVLSIYQDMENKAKYEAKLSAKDELLSSFTRQRARSLLDESTLYKTACLNNFEFKDVPHIILQMLRRDDEMSEDSLLGPGMMLASVSNLGSFDNLKTSQSLGELGFMDLGSTQVVGLEEDENLSYRDKVLRFLKLTKSDVARIKLNKSTVENDIFTVEDDIWNRVMASGTHINKPKQTRTEIFIREIPQPEETVNTTKNQQKGALKFDISFSNLLVGKQGEFQDDQDEEDSLIFSQDEEDGKEDEETIRLFMSNIKEGIFIRRLGLDFGIKLMKGNRYEKLYKQDFMSAIGPEVFERATNLPKVTSFTKIVRNSVSLPDILQTSRKKNISRENSRGKIYQTSSSDLYLRDPELFKKQILSEESFSEKDAEKTEEISPADEILKVGPSQANSGEEENEGKKQNESRNLEDKEIKMTNDFSNFELSNIKDKICFPLSNLSVTDLNKVKELKPCFRKKRILIKRTGKQRTLQFQELSYDSCWSPENSSNGSDQLMGSQTQFVKENTENCQQSNTTFSKQENNSRNSFNMIDDKPSSFKKKQIYFIKEILKNPLWKVSITYFDLNKKTASQEKFELRFQKMINALEVRPREEKIWKSDVLKTVETSFMPKYSQTSGSSFLIKKDSKKTECLYLLDKKKSFLEKEEQILTSEYNAMDYEGLFTPGFSSTNFNNKHDFEDDINLKLANEVRQNYEINSETSDFLDSLNNAKKDVVKNSNFSASTNPPKVFTSKKNAKVVRTSDMDFPSSKAKVIKTQNTNEKGMEKKLNSVKKNYCRDLAKEDSFCSQESDEPISLYYSKAADLASPLLDMRRFIYPDHIHYSYKHVNKKGFDVDINGGFPLLVGENLPRSTPLNVVNESTTRSREPEIKSRPMDLSFATTNAFAAWQNKYSKDLEATQNQTTDNYFSPTKESESHNADYIKNVKAKKMKYLKKINEKKESRVLNVKSKSKSKSKPYGKNFHDFTFMYSAKDYVLIEKLLRMHMQFNKNEFLKFESRANESRIPDQISSTQLHSNKGRKNSIKNPVVFLQKNKNRKENKIIETQEERTKDVFARLASQAFLQNSNIFTSSGS